MGSTALHLIVEKMIDKIHLLSLI